MPWVTPTPPGGPTGDNGVMNDRAEGERRGRLRIYLGAAPGVGKTYAMLDEGRRRASRGTDVVAALVEAHGRPPVEGLLADLEGVPALVVEDGGHERRELDVAATVARAPDVALVDDLAHTNAPGAHRAKRWQDVQELLDAAVQLEKQMLQQRLEELQAKQRSQGLDETDKYELRTLLQARIGRH